MKSEETVYNEALDTVNNEIRAAIAKAHAAGISAETLCVEASDTLATAIEDVMI